MFADEVEGQVSVCMATHNGTRFVREQIDSILPQLAPTDELVIVDDASTDGTVNLIRAIADPRIRLFANEINLGVVKTFERALGLARGEFIFLSDQDDLWRPEKVMAIKRAFAANPKTTLVVSDATIIDAEGNELGSWNDRLPFRSSIAATLVRNRYVGAFMAVRRSVIKACLPFPAALPMHDVWIALVNHLVGNTEFLAQPLLCYRRHKDTVTTGKHAEFLIMTKWRISLLRNLVQRAITTYLDSHLT